MDQATLEKMVRAGKLTSEEVLAHTPVDRLDDTLTFLKRHCEVKEICGALTERIASASPGDFGKLKDLYFEHCG
jgi:hypothetical protein